MTNDLLPVVLRPRLKWRRVRSGKYVAGPYVVTRLPLHRPIWSCTRYSQDSSLMTDMGHHGTAADAKQAAADDYMATKGTT